MTNLPVLLMQLSAAQKISIVFLFKGNKHNFICKWRLLHPSRRYPSFLNQDVIIIIIMPHTPPSLFAIWIILFTFRGEKCHCFLSRIETRGNKVKGSKTLSKKQYCSLIPSYKRGDIWKKLAVRQSCKFCGSGKNLWGGEGPPHKFNCTLKLLVTHRDNSNSCNNTYGKKYFWKAWFATVLTMESGCFPYWFTYCCSAVKVIH